MTHTTELGLSIRLSMFELRETGNWDIFLGPPERAREETCGADQRVLQRRKLPKVAVVNKLFSASLGYTLSVFNKNSASNLKDKTYSVLLTYAHLFLKVTQSDSGTNICTAFRRLLSLYSFKPRMDHCLFFVLSRLTERMNTKKALSQMKALSRCLFYQRAQKILYEVLWKSVGLQWFVRTWQSKDTGWYTNLLNCQAMLRSQVLA